MPSKNHRSNFIKTRKADKQAASANAMEVTYSCPKRNSEHVSALKTLIMRRLNRNLANYDRMSEKRLLDKIFGNLKN